jgi:hypothetical protein
MEPKLPSPQLIALSEALTELRDSWVLISMALKDHLTESASPLRDEAMCQVELQLTRIWKGE